MCLTLLLFRCVFAIVCLVLIIPNDFGGESDGWHQMRYTSFTNCVFDAYHPIPIFLILCESIEMAFACQKPIAHLILLPFRPCLTLNCVEISMKRLYIF